MRKQTPTFAWWRVWRPLLPAGASRKPWRVPLPMWKLVSCVVVLGVFVDWEVMVEVDLGADAVLIHSKKDNPSDIQAFMKSWNHQGENIVCNKPAFCHHSLFSLFPLFLAPVVIVPTKYYQTPTDDFRKLGISTVIWANHNLRACVTAIQNTSKSIYENQSLVGVEKKIASVKEVFRLQNDSELKSAEKKYLPS
eukprot:Sdes_comp20938_c0_seq16m18434